MVDNSELPFRMMSRRYGADAAHTPTIHSRVFSENERYRSTEFTTCKLLAASGLDPSNVNGQGSSQTENSSNNTPSASFPAGAAVPPTFAFMALGNEGNRAHQASIGHEGEHGEPDVQRDDAIHIILTGSEQASVVL
ncbi:uncharacterized protein LOC133927382 [Phragmites australis]|uniref:uncharacterized protein LOC133927382 n=1 Tax=Phragmites australis TaxID=29695 RepID=UPI002D79B961|nr:uncharacterized protein LOC133927382 [Phragmites australis]